MRAITDVEYKAQRFKAFFDQNYPRVKQFAWNILKSEEDAEDMAQDIFVKLWERPELWIDRDKWDGFLYTVVRNQIYNFLKRRKVELAPLDGENAEIDIEDLSMPTPDDALTARELELLIQMGVERMPEQRRRVFLMNRQRGMTANEIAEMLGISVRTVEQHIYKALQDLKKIIPILIFSLFD